jgi:hypothetical protein
MDDKPRRAGGYSPAMVDYVKKTCLYIATKLGDLLDGVVVVGGLVPSLLISPDKVKKYGEPHVGTTDLDLGLSLVLLDEQRYEELTKRLRQAGFENDVNTSGKPVRQRWLIRTKGFTVTVDFLIPPSKMTDKPGSLRNIENNFAAIITPGLHLAFEDHVLVSLDGETIEGGKAQRQIKVCGPGAFIVLKAHAFRQRGLPKDAYDLHYVIRYYGDGLKDVIQCLKPLRKDDMTRGALDILRQDFTDLEAIGPLRVALFLRGAMAADIQADVAGDIAALIKAWEKL